MVFFSWKEIEESLEIYERKSNEECVAFVWDFETRKRAA